MMAHPGDVCVLIAAFNEAPVIADVIAGVRSAGYAVVVIDDGSVDGTGDIARRSGADVLVHAVNRGKGAALQTGTDYLRASGDCRIIVHFDADGQHDPADIATLVSPIRDGAADVVLGSRFLGSTENMPLVRKLVLKAGILFTTATAGVRLTDVHNGLRAFRRDVWERISLTEDRFAYASELVEKIAAVGCRILEVPVHVRYTPYSIRKGQRSLNAIAIAWRVIARRLHG